jgi:hypothetical protein
MVTFEKWFKTVPLYAVERKAAESGWHARDAEIKALQSRIDAVRAALDSDGDWEDREHAIRAALGPAGETKKGGVDG